MAKRNSGGLSGLSISELNREINRRRRSLPALQRRREKAMEKVARIDAMIAELGGSAGSVRRGPGRPRGSSNNNGTLVDFLRRALTNNTMGVTEVAEAVKGLGYNTTSPNFRTIVNAALMNKKHGFKRVSRGKYTVA
ncbi:MAG: hypothetical protein K2Q09_04890 [Phycisphaerales bacterium]|nr:hypothetical protein [Phycisphaerales bacterium]